MISCQSRGMCVSAIVVSCAMLYLVFLRPIDVAAQTSKSKAAANATPPKTAQRTIRVCAVGPDGKPLPGTKIHASIWTEEPFKPNRDYVCDSKGQTVVELPRTLAILRLWAYTPGYVPLFAHWEQEELRADKDAIPKQFTFSLTKGTTIGGVVQDKDGRPIAGARVGVMCRGGRNENQRVVRAGGLADGDDARITDAQGRWTLDNVPAGDDVGVLLSVVHPDYISDMKWGGLQKLQEVTLQALRQQKAVLTMYRGIAVTGSVTDAAGKPLARAVVVWGDDPYSQTGSHQEHRQEVRTDARGVYRLPPLPPLTLTLTVIAEGWAPDLRKIDLTANDHKVDFRLKPGKKLRIRFVDDAGKPIPGVFVQIRRWRDCKSLYNIKHPIVLETKIPDSADQNGVYQWTWAPADEVEYYFGKQGYHDRDNQPITADGREHKIVLYRAADE